MWSMEHSQMSLMCQKEIAPPPPMRKNVQGSAYRYWTEAVSGALCWRDGYKTWHGTPNGQDVWDNKLVVVFAY